MPAEPHARPGSRWSWRVGRIGGIPIRIHLTLGFLLLWIAVSSSITGLGPRDVLGGILLVVIVFAIIVIHELGHALMARRYGIATHEIVLLPIGGIARLGRTPDQPSQELAVALVGPLINLALAGVLWIFVGFDLDPEAPMSFGRALVVQLVWINIVLAVFNLIPAFPMDGGRALRALLSMKLTRRRATEIAATLGQGFAVMLGVLGLFYNAWLAVIGVVVWLGARQEAQMVRLRAALVDVPVSAAMNRAIETITPDRPLEEAAQILVSHGRDQLAIVDHGETVGVLTRQDVASGLTSAGGDASVGAAPHHEAISVAPDASLEGVFDRLVQTPEAIAVVVEGGRPVGIVSADQLAAFVALHHPADAAARR
jgi:Zn-dependent protease/predicted transcriptional regulator